MPNGVIMAQTERRVKSRGYVAWVNMRQRCRNPHLKDFASYGKRGLAFDRRWESFEAFSADMGEPPPGMTLERRDTMGDYGPTNCQWATRGDQALKKRTCVRYTFQGRSLTLPEWARELGVHRITLLKRLQGGMPIDVAFTTAVAPRAPRTSTQYEFQGQSHTLAEWSRATGIPRLTLLKRLTLGWSVPLTLTTPPDLGNRRARNGVVRPSAEITHHGRSRTIVEWAAQTGIKSATIRRRLALGWSITKTLTTPPADTPRKGSSTPD